jgi:vacuolar-type H+-ATPase subunit H
MENEEDKDILHHLLHLEAEASALVDGAQAEADRRVSEGENRNRIRHDEVYAAEVAKLEASYNGEINAVREDYKKQLDSYRNSLTSMPLDHAAFSALAGKFLTERK